MTSWELAEELASVLRRPRIRRYEISDDDVSDVLRLLAPFLPSVEVGVEVSIRDPKDVPAVVAALAGGAEVIITGDHDFLDDLELREWLSDRGITVMTPAEAVR